MDTLIDLPRPLEEAEHWSQRESFKSGPNSDIGCSDTCLYRGPVVGRDDKISERARAAIGVLQEEFEVVSHDWHRTEALWRAIGLLGRPSGSSPPQALALPTSPPEWWRNRPPGMTPDKWIEKYYKKFIPAGLTRGFFQQQGQDKTFANALIEWENQPQSDEPDAPKNRLPGDLYIPTKAELNTRRLRQMGIADPTQFRDGARLYQAARRRIG